MAVTKARKATKRSTPATADAGAGASSSMSMAPPPGPGGLSELQQPPPLPPGVYFNPTNAESIGFLNRWIAGDDKMPDARGFILHADMYDNDPYALQRLHPPASARAGEHTWWFLGESKFQSPCSAAENKRADRSVRTGGFWRVEQSKEELPEEGGLKNCFGFYYVPPPPAKKLKTPWLMQEFTSDMDRGAGRRGVPALHKLYVTPRPEGLREIYGEDGLTAGNKKPVPADYFAAAAALMPPGSVRGLRQEHVEPPQPQASELPPSPPPLLDYGDDDDGQNFMDGIMSSVGPLHYDDSQKGQNSMGAANVLGQYQQQHDEDGPEDNFSIPMDQFMKIFDKPAETEGEEPAWDSLPDIVDQDEFLKFNKDA
ncbi:uncharacterized protein [Aegilops tauschii subsp. strangulata]|nr:uncharacterized protein LOC120969616 [Aegilops tauschii subsp. strangulata]XP_044444801.1 uncharacterized protein LOC123171306 [Triticum aestivum]